MGTFFKLGAVTYGGVTPTTIPQITDSNVSEDLDRVNLRGSGAVYETFGAIRKISPRATFTTQAAKTALGITTTFVEIDSDNELILYFQQCDSMGTVVAAGAKTATCTKGMLILRTVSAADGDVASCQFEVIAISTDGSTDPWTYADNATMPTDEADEAYTCAPGDLTLSQWTYTVGAMEEVMSVGTVYPTDAWIDHFESRITATAEEAQDPGDVTLASVELTDYVEGSAHGTSAITLTINDGIEWSGGISASGGRATSDISVACYHNGTDAPVTISGLT